MTRPAPPAENPDLFAAVVAAPADDVPRLVYADWLEENGQPERAEFIRIQCRHDGIRVDHPDWNSLVDRDMELSTWLQTFAPIAVPALPRGFAPTAGRRFDYDDNDEIDRGFPLAVADHAPGGPRRDAFGPPMAWLDEMIRTTTIRSLLLYQTRPDHLLRLLGHPAAAALTGLAVLTHANPDLARVIADSPGAANLTRLDFSGYLTDSQCAALAGAAFPRLRNFETGGLPGGAEGMARIRRAGWFADLTDFTLFGPSDVYDLSDISAFTDGPPLPNLRSFKIDEGQISAAGAAALARSRAFPNLVEFELIDTPVEDDGVAALARAPWPLAFFRGYGCGFGAASAGHIVGAEWASTLKVLDVSENTLGPGLTTLVGSRRFGNLRHLNAEATGAGADALHMLAGNPALRWLTWLSLRQDDARGVPVKAVAAALAAFAMPELRYLELDGWPVGTTGAKAIATNPAFANLYSLELDGCRLGDAGAAALAASPYLRNLIRLELADNDIGAAAEAFADENAFPRLARLVLSGNPIPAAARRKLKRRPGVIM